MISESDSDYNEVSADHIELMWIKRIMIGCIGVLIIHLGAGIWWAATMTANVVYLRNDIVRLSADLQTTSTNRYSVNDAVKDFQTVYFRIERNETRINKLEDRVNGIVISRT